MASSAHLLDDPVYNTTPEGFWEKIQTYPQPKQRMIFNDSRWLLKQGRLTGITSEALDAFEQELFPPPPVLPTPPGILERIGTAVRTPFKKYEVETPQPEAAAQALTWEQGQGPPALPALPELGQALQGIAASLGIGQPPEPVVPRPEYQTPSEQPVLPRPPQVSQPVAPVLATGLPTLPQIPPEVQDEQTRRQAEFEAETTTPRATEAPMLPPPDTGAPAQPGLIERALERLQRGTEETFEAERQGIAQTPGLRELSRASSDVMAGILGTTAGVIQAPALFESLLGLETGVGQKGQNAATVVRKAVQGLQPTDPTFLDKLLQGLGSTAPLIIPGLGMAGLATRVFGFSPAAAAWVGTTAATIPEVAVEGTQTYQDLLDKGQTKAEAASTSKWVMAANAVLLPLTNRLGIFGERGRAARQLVMSALMEGGQEAAQGVIQRLAVEKGVQPADVGPLIEEFLIGGILGGGFKGASLAIQGRGTPAAPETEITPEPLAPVPTAPVETPLAPVEAQAAEAPPVLDFTAVAPTPPVQTREYLIRGDDGRLGKVILGREGQASFFEITNPKTVRRYKDLTGDIDLPSDAFNEVFPAKREGLRAEDLAANRQTFVQDYEIPATRIGRGPRGAAAPPSPLPFLPGQPTPEFPIAGPPMFPPATQPMVSRQEEPPTAPPFVPAELRPETAMPVEEEPMLPGARPLPAPPIFRPEQTGVAEDEGLVPGGPVPIPPAEITPEQSITESITPAEAEVPTLQSLDQLERSGDERYYIKQRLEDNGDYAFTPIEAKPVAIAGTPSPMELIIHKNQLAEGVPWVISDAVTGAAIAHGQTQAEVKSVTRKLFQDRTPDEIQKKLIALMQSNGISPRYRIRGTTMPELPQVETLPPGETQGTPPPAIVAPGPILTEQLAQISETEANLEAELRALDEQQQSRFSIIRQRRQTQIRAELAALAEARQRREQQTAAEPVPPKEEENVPGVPVFAQHRVQGYLRDYRQWVTEGRHADARPAMGNLTGNEARAVREYVESTMAAPTLEQQAASISDTDLEAMIDEEIAALGGEAPDAVPILISRTETPVPEEPGQLPQPPAPATPGEALGQLGTDVSSAMQEGLKGLQAIFGKGHGVQMSIGVPIPSFDPEVYRQALPHFQQSWASAKAAGGDIRLFAKLVLQQTGAAVKPYLIQFIKSPDDWVATAPQTAEAPTTPDVEPAAPEEQLSPIEQMPLPPGEGEVNVRASEQIAAYVEGRIMTGNRITADELFATANQAYGGTQAQGIYTPKDAYDAMEMGVNQYIMNTGFLADPARNITQLRNIVNRLPTQSKRTTEQDNFQQFSTPPHLGYLVARMANLSPADIVLEPSAGLGGLAAFAKQVSAHTIVNELSPRRAALLRSMGFDQVFTENAEQLHNILPPSVKPTVVLMNPPFSASGERLPGKRQTQLVTLHLDQALRRLEPNGRLVAIVGRGLADDRATFKDWWQQVKTQYNVRANIGLPGKEYAKYGTTFDNQLLIIDKTGATPAGGTITDRVESLDDALPLLEGIRNDRPAISRGPTQPPGEQPARPPTPGAEWGPGGTVAPPPAPTPGLGPDVGGGGGPGPLPIPEGERGGTPGGGPGGRPEIPPDIEPGGGEPEPAGDLTAEGRGELSLAPDTSPPGEVTVPEPAITVTSQAPTPRDPSIELTDALYDPYVPQKLQVEGAIPHRGKLAQSAAMATVEPPDPTYTPMIPREILESGELSIAQLEAIVYAGQAHEQMLPQGPRRGFFIGDGTGVGKAREIAGIILDNFARGRRKAVWVSMNADLFRSAVRESGKVGLDEKLFLNVGKIKPSASIKNPEGILYTTYSTLRNSANPTRDAAGNEVPGKKRLDQLVEWLGEDFEGVIAFDESHNMANSLPTAGARGVQNASLQALTGMALQERLPNARVIYVSATGATEVGNLAYALRLGLWGTGRAFATVHAFVNQIRAGGLAAMELVARDLKARGLYLARNLSYENVTYETLEHQLTEEQRQIYDTFADAWQIVLNNINAAMQASGSSSNPRARSAAMSAFWGSNQRFWNQIMIAMQFPAVITRMKADLAQADGPAMVLQLVNTGEAQQNRKLAQLDPTEMTAEDLEALDLSPKDILMQMIANSFPVAQYEEYLDGNGNLQSRPVLDSEGRPVMNTQAVERREALLDDLGRRLPGIDNVLDQLLENFGPEHVAEVTGRSRRRIRVTDERGEHAELQKWSDANARADAKAFMDDKKRILIFSEKGGTGANYHADLDSTNQRKRIHYLVQPGWRADRAVQGMGRTHRTNQASAPHYVLVTTDLKGQKRFLSSIARRLDQLGALTKGQRQTGSQGLFSARDNLESTYAQDAHVRFWLDLYNERIEGLEFVDVIDRMGLQKLRDPRTGGLNTGELPEVTQFLNRILSLNIDYQNRVFDAFSERIDENIAGAMAAGTLDAGVETVRALSADIVDEQTVYTDEETGAETKYIHIRLTHPRRIVTFDKMLDLEQREKPGNVLGFFVHPTSGRVSVVRKVGQRTLSSGAVVDRLFSESPTTILSLDTEEFQALRGISHEEARPLWDTAVGKASPTYTEEMHLLTGALLPIWDRLTGGTRVNRVQTSDGQRLLGRVIPPMFLQETLKNLGATAASPVITPEEAVAKILDDRHVIRLANGWTLKRSRVSNEYRIELLGPTYTDQNVLQSEGAFFERISFNTRIFLPTGPTAPQVFANVTKYRPVLAVEPPTQTADDVLASQQTQAFALPAEPQGDVQALALPLEPTAAIPPTAVGTESAPGVPAPEEDEPVQHLTLLPESMRRPLLEGEAPTAPKPSQILKDLEQALNLPMRTGRMRSTQGTFRLAQYSPHNRVVRLKLANDVEAAGHELGHFLADTLRLNDLTEQYQRELTYLAPAGYAEAAQPEEGLAEFVRYYLTNDDLAHSSMPAPFYESFEEALREQAPTWQAAMLQAREQYTQFAEASPEARVGAVISTEKPGRRPKSLSYWWHEFYRANIEDLHWVKVVRDRMAQGTPLAPEDDAYLLGRLIRGVNGKVGNMLRHGMVARDDLTTRVSKGFPEILNPWAEDLTLGDRSDLRRYLIARGSLEAIENELVRSARESRRTGRPVAPRTVVPIRRTDDEVAIRNIEARRPDVRQTFDDLRAFEDAGLAYVRASGMLSDEAFATIQSMHRNHMPLYRVIEASTPLDATVFMTPEPQGTGTGSTKFGNVATPVRRRHGSGRDIIDPLESIIKNTYAFVSAADRNAVMQALTRQAAESPGMGHIIEPLATPTRPTTVEIETIRRDLERAGIEIPEGAEEALVSIWRPNMGPQGDNMVWVWENGRRQLYQMAPELYRSVNALDQETVDMWVRIVSAPAQLLRLGATQLNPDFMVKNPIRDIISAWVTAGLAMPKGIAQLAGAMISPGRRQALQDVYNAWELSGGSYSALVSMDRAMVQESLKDFLRVGHLGRQVRYPFSHPIKALRTFSEMSELVTRLSVFRGALPKGGLDAASTNDLLKAGFEARDIIDFGRHGAKLTAIRHMTAFWNANVQGIDKLARTLFVDGTPTDRAAAWMRAVGGITLPSILLWMVNSDDERYRRLPQWLKDIAWLAPIGDTFIPIPKPPLIGQFFGSVPERFMDYWFAKDPEAVKELFRTMRRGLDFSFLPTGIVAPLENYFNKSIFFDRPLVPRGREALIPSEQYSQSTHETSKYLATPFEGLQGVPMLGELSAPAKLENLVIGYTGGLGRYGLSVGDWMIDLLDSKQKPAAPASSLASKIPGVRAFVVREPSSQAPSIERFYEKLIAARAIDRTLDEKKKTDLEDARRLVQEHREELQGLPVLEAAHKQIKAIDDVMHQTYRSTTMTPEQKRAKITEMIRKKQELTERALGRLLPKAPLAPTGTEGIPARPSGPQAPRPMPKIPPS